MKTYDNPEIQSILIKIQKVIDNIENWTVEQTKRSSPYSQNFFYSCDKFRVNISGGQYNYDIGITYYNDRDDIPSTTWLIIDNIRNDQVDENLAFIKGNDIYSIKKIGYDNVIAEFSNTGLAYQVYKRLLSIYPDAMPASTDEILNKVNQGLDDILKEL